MVWAIFGGVALLVFLRANANAGAANGNPLDQTVTKIAQAFVPFAHAGNAATPQLGGTSNPRAVDGNGVPLVSTPTAAVVNIGSQDAVINQNYDNSNAQSVIGGKVFTFTDPSTGITTPMSTYWRAMPNLNIGGNSGSVGTWMAPIIYSGANRTMPSGATMVNCPPPQTDVTTACTAVPLLRNSVMASW